MKRAVAWVGGAGLMVTVFSFVNQMVIAYRYGSSTAYDIFLATSGPAMMAIGIIGGVFGHALVVHFVKALGDDEGARRLSGAALLLTFTVAIPLVALGCLWAPVLVASLVPPKVQAQTLGVDIMRLAWLTLLITLPAQVLTCVLTSRQRFLVGSLAAGCPALGSIIIILFWPSPSPVVLSFGLACGSALMLLWLSIYAWPYIRMPNKSAIRSFFDLASSFPAIILSMTGFTCFALVDGYWGLRQGESVVSTLGYGQRLLVSFANLVAVGPAVVLIPSLAVHLRSGDLRQLELDAVSAIRVGVVCMGLASIPVAVCSKEVVQLIFMRGSFTKVDAESLSAVLPVLLVGMVAMVGVVLTFKIMYVLGMWWTAAMIGSGIAIVYFIAAGALANIWGIQGMCLAYGLVWWVALAASVSLIWFRIGKKTGFPQWIGSTSRQVKWLVFIGIVCWGVRSGLAIDNELSSVTILFVVLMSGCMAGIVGLRYHPIPELTWVRQLIPLKIIGNKI